MFSDHPKSAFWSRKNTKTPNEVALNSHKKFWFDCDNCHHSFETILKNITRQNTWCSYCSNRPQKLCENNDCNSCFENSFASHEKSIYLHDKKINPRTIFKGTHKKFLFNCDKCGHSFETILHSITQRNSWCPYCSNPPQKLCENNDCNSCFEKSFASHEKSIYLHDKTINPRTIFKGTDKKFLFNCDKCGHSFETALSSITQRNSWCPYCLNKTEQILFDKLVLYYPLLKRQYKKDWCKKINYLPFDFVIEDLKIIIELDGNQHFEQIGNWMSPEKTQENDLYKMKCANENGFSVIRILQKDVYYDKYDWLDDLMKNIGILKAETVINIYLSKGNEYDCFNSIKSGL